MGFLDALRRKPVEDDYYDDYSAYDNGYSDDYDYEGDYDRSYEEDNAVASQGVAGIQPIHSMADMEIVLFTPSEYKDAVDVADCVREMKFVVLNLNRMESGVAGRLLDFLSGVAYSENSHVQRVATNTYIILPYFVDFIDSL